MTLSELASKAKRPAIAGGAVATAVAGGIAIARNGRGKKLSDLTQRASLPKASLPDVSMPRLGGRESVTKALGATTKALGKTAVEVGKAGYRVGELTSEVRRVREQVSDD